MRASQPLTLITAGLGALAAAIAYVAGASNPSVERPEPALSWAAAVRTATFPPPPPRLSGPGEAGVYGCCALTGPRKLKGAEPLYPETALAAGIHGSVLLELHIDTGGKVENARVLKGVPALDDVALAAVRAWVYEPARLRGKAVPAVLTARIDFTPP